jgi:tRNA (cmo5U34)-methyltransferase
VTAVQGDVREVDFAAGSFDVIVAAAVLHHLRADAEWEAVFAALHRWLRPGGSVWVSDLVDHANPFVRKMIWRRYGEYLSDLKGGGDAGERYRQAVFDYVDAEDTPRPLVYQLDLLRQCGFGQVEVLHMNTCFAAYGAVKAG